MNKWLKRLNQRDQALTSKFQNQCDFYGFTCAVTDRAGALERISYGCGDIKVPDINGTKACGKGQKSLRLIQSCTGCYYTGTGFLQRWIKASNESQPVIIWSVWERHKEDSGSDGALISYQLLMIQPNFTQGSLLSWDVDDSMRSQSLFLKLVWFSLSDISLSTVLSHFVTLIFL